MKKKTKLVSPIKKLGQQVAEANESSLAVLSKVISSSSEVEFPLEPEPIKKPRKKYTRKPIRVKDEISVNELFLLLLRKKKMTAKKLSEILGCAESTISQRINNAENLWTETVVEMMEGLEVEFELLNSEMKPTSIQSFVTMNQVRTKLGEFYFKFKDNTGYKIIQNKL